MIMEESLQQLREGDDGEDQLEKGLLLSSSQQQQQQQQQTDDDDDDEDDDEVVVYSATLQQETEETEETEDGFIKLKTTQWILYSLLFILAWGFGFLMLLYTPVRRCILRRTFRSRQLYLTPNSIVYKVTKPLPFPCFGSLSRHKHILLASVSDLVIQQGYLQSRYGVYSIRIENVGVARPSSDQLQIEAIANPQAFRNAVLMRLLALRNEVLCTQTEDTSTPMPPLKVDTLSHVGEFAILQKLDEVSTSLKRLQLLFEEQQPKTSVSID